jgi:putative DNA primase/helicase
MTSDRGGPFAPIHRLEPPDNLDGSNAGTGELVVVTPVPEIAERPEDAATRLFGLKPDNCWCYHDERRNLLFAVVRWNLPGGKKKILPLSWVRHPDGHESWEFRSPHAPRPLYHLHDLAILPKAPVVIVEGEKCADAARQIFQNSVVTTSPGGAAAVNCANWRSLAHRSDVLIWPDADEPGKVYGERVASILQLLGVPKILVVDAAAFAGCTPDGNTREPLPSWDVADASEEGWTADALREAAYKFAKPWKPPGPMTEWPAGFEMTADGLARIEQNEDDAERSLFTGPFTVLGEGRDRVGAGRGLWITWMDRDDRTQRAFVRRANLVGDGVDWLKELADRGFPGPIERRKINSLRQALHGCRPADRITMVRRTGWFGSAFVLPRKTIGQTEGETVMFDGRTDIARYAEKGSIAEWKQYVAAPATKNSRLLFFISAGFAGPLVDLLDEGSFGFNLVGRSSIGKTAALIAAGSIWGGGGPLGFACSWRTTDNGAEGVFCAHSGTIVPLDEHGQLPAEVAGALTYMFGNGHGKSRATRSGEAQRIAEWRGVLLSTGEVGVAAKIEEVGRGRKAKAGQLVRLVDVPADADTGFGLFDDCDGEPAAAFAQHLNTNAMTYYGSAGPSFLAHIATQLATSPITVKDELRGRIDTVQNKLMEDHGGADGQIMRVARYFALVAVAGELAREALDLPWGDGEAYWASRRCFKAWLAQRGGSERQEILSATTAIREAIEIHGPARFQHLNDMNDAADGINGHGVRDLLGYRFKWREETVWGFTTAGIKEVVRGIGDSTTLIAELTERGVILRGDDRIQIEKKIGGTKRRLYAVPDSLLTSP